MHCIAPTEKDTGNAALGKRLWDAAGQFRASSGLKSQKYSAPVLGLIFLHFAAKRVRLCRLALVPKARRASVNYLGYRRYRSASPRRNGSLEGQNTFSK